MYLKFEIDLTLIFIPGKKGGSGRAVSAIGVVVLRIKFHTFTSPPSFLLPFHLIHYTVLGLFANSYKLVGFLADPIFGS